MSNSTHHCVTQLSHIALLQASLLCTDVIKNNYFSLNFSPWKYIVNLAGTELPLYSVDDLSERLTVRPVKFSLLSYYERKYDVRFRYTWGLKKEKGKLIYSRLTRKPPPPFGLQVYKGTIHILRKHIFRLFFIPLAPYIHIRGHSITTWKR